jgi:hypothetical protein
LLFIYNLKEKENHIFNGNNYGRNIKNKYY